MWRIEAQEHRSGSGTELSGRTRGRERRGKEVGRRQEEARRGETHRRRRLREGSRGMELMEGGGRQHRDRALCGGEAVDSNAGPSRPGG
eukprot:2327380-Rhodomonas_salina.4